MSGVSRNRIHQKAQQRHSLNALEDLKALQHQTNDKYGSREGTIQKYFANPKKYFKSQYYSQITVEKFDKSKKLLQILRNFVDPQITFSIIRKYFANP